MGFLVKKAYYWRILAEFFIRRRIVAPLRRRFKEGFSLVQMSVILAISGIAVSATIPGEKAGSNNEKYLASMERLGGSIQRAFNTYRAKYGRLPCPADGTKSVDDSDAGVEADNEGSCTGGVLAANFSSGNVVAGIIPYATLGLQERQVRDQWGRWITYAVDKRGTESEQCLNLDTGDIVVNNYGTDVNVMFTFVVHGPNGQGAFVPVRGNNTGTRLKPAVSDTDALKNASLDTNNNDDFTGQFVKKDLVPGTFESFVWMPPNSNVCCYGFSGCYKCNGSIIGSANSQKISNPISSSGNYAGQTLAKADFNNDTVDDLVIGVPNASSDTGAVYVIFGRPSLGEEFAVNFVNGDTGFAVTGASTGDYFGASVAAGDVNGDGRPDLIVGAPEAGSGAGKVYVIYGMASYSSSYTASGRANGTNGFVINGSAGEKIGYSVASGNVNSNGYATIIFSGKGVAVGDKGAAYAIWGTSTWAASNNLATLIDNTGSSGVKLAGSGSDTYGWNIAAADIDGDSYDDLLVTNPGGNAYVMFGAAAFTSDKLTSAMTGTAGKKINNHAQSSAGQKITPLDFNGDGISDFALASRSNNVLDSNVVSYVLYGSVTAKAAWPNTFDVTTLDGMSTPAGFKVLDGTSVSSVVGGDLDNDGNDELVIGQTGFDPDAITNAGRVVVIYGTASMTDSFDLQSTTPILINGQLAATAYGKFSNDYFGSNSLVADIRHDNGNDLMVGIPGFDNGGLTDDGRVQIIGRCKWRCGNLFGDGTYYGHEPEPVCDSSQCQGYLPCVVLW